MNKEQIQELLKKAGVEGVESINLDVVHTGINDFGTTLKNKGIEEGKQQVNKDEVVVEFLKEKGFNSIDDYDNFVKTTKEQLTDVDKVKLELDNKLKSYEGQLEEMKKYQEQSKTLELENKFIKQGIKDVDYVKFQYSQAKDKEDFNEEEFFNGLKEEKPYLFGEDNNNTNVVAKVDTSNNNDNGGELSDFAKGAGLTIDDIK